MNQEIQTKKCSHSNCLQIKPIIEFSKNKNQKDGYHCWCKTCSRLQNKLSYQKHKTTILEKNKLHYNQNKIDINFKRTLKRPLKKEYMYNYGITYRLKNKEKISLRNKQRRLNNINYYLIKEKENRRRNKSTIHQYLTKRTKTDVNFRIRRNCTRRTNLMLKGYDKSAHTAELHGCDWHFLGKYLKAQLPHGLSMNDYGAKVGQWSIDHIIPCSLFDFTNPTEQKQCCHYTNLRPLLHIENIRKGNKTKGLKLLYNNTTPFIN